MSELYGIVSLGGTVIGASLNQRGLKGETGATGATGNGIASISKTGSSGLIDTYTITYTNGNTATFTVTNGQDGHSPIITASKSGKTTSVFLDGTKIAEIDDGVGIDSIYKTGSSGLDPVVDEYTILYDDGNYTTFTVTNGKKGDTGATGNGIATIAKTSTSGLVDTYTITFTDGTSTTFEVTNGQDGEVTYDELSELLPTETASGDIASFNDGQAVIPAVSVVATITPIQSGSGTPSPSNVRPISGHDEVEVGVVGKNLFDENSTPTYGQYYGSGTYSDNTARMMTDYIPIIPNTDYIAQVDVDRTASLIFLNYNYFDENKNWIGNRTTNGDTSLIGLKTKSINISNSNAKYLRLVVTSDPDGSTMTGRTFANADLQLEFGTTATTYEPYTKTDYTTTLPSTTYGGTLDLVSGLLTVDRASLMFDGTESWYSVTAGTGANRALFAGISNPPTGGYSWDLLGNYIQPTGAAYSMPPLWTAEFNTNGFLYVGVPTTITTVAEWETYLASNPLQFVYKLATPTTYQLTPQQIDTLKGQNNITATSGQVSVTYKADIQKYIEKHITVYNGGVS